MDLFVFIFLTLVSFGSTGFVDIDFLMKPETVKTLPAADSPLPQLFVDAPSYLVLNLTFNIGRAPNTGNYDPIMEIVVVHSSLLPKIGVNIAPTVDTVLKPGTGYCCDEYLNEKLLCKDDEKGKLVISGIDRSKAATLFHYYAIYENNISTHLNKFDFKDRISFRDTGVWYVIMANCNPATQTADNRGSETVATVGYLEWKNPYGFLPGQVVAYLPIYWSLATFLFIYSLLWSLLSCIYRKGLMVLQLLIGVVIIACLTDAVVSGAGYLTYNLEGRIYLYTVGLAAFLGSVKSTGIRVLFLCVGMGLSITRVKLTIPEYLFTTIIALCFFAFDLAYEFQKLTTTSGEPVWNILTWVANIGLFFANIIFLAWIVFSTYTTMFELKQEGQTFKFSQYKTLVILILICLCLSLILAIFQVVVEALHVQDEWFRWWWIWEMFWQIVSLAGLIAISMLWRPSTNNNQYAYSMQIPTEDPSGQDRDIELDAADGDNIGLDEPEPTVNTEVGNKTANISSDEDSLTSSSL